MYIHFIYDNKLCVECFIFGFLTPHAMPFIAWACETWDGDTTIPPWTQIVIMCCLVIGSAMWTVVGEGGGGMGLGACTSIPTWTHIHWCATTWTLTLLQNHAHSSSNNYSLILMCNCFHECILSNNLFFALILRILVSSLVSYSKYGRLALDPVTIK